MPSSATRPSRLSSKRQSFMAAYSIGMRLCIFGAGTVVVCVQNGIPWWYDERLTRLDPDRALARAIARERVVGAVAYSANEIVAPGVVENHVPGNNMLVIGRPDREETPLVRALREA